MPRCNFCLSLTELTRRQRAPAGRAVALRTMGMAGTCPACRAIVNFGRCTPAVFNQVKQAIADWEPPRSRRWTSNS